MNLAASQFQLVNRTTTLATLIIVLAVVLAYVTDFFNFVDPADFLHFYADPIFLALLIFSIAMQFKHADSLVDPIFWLLLGSAFFAWFGLTIARIFLFEQLTQAQINLATNICYFFYYVLTIAAIELKNYQKVEQLLTKESLLIWISGFSFAIGLLVIFVLTADPQHLSADQRIHSHFIFYLTLDVYVFARWLKLTWQGKDTHWLSYLLFALAALNWLVADAVEALTISQRLILDSGTWADWLWYTPYLFALIATQLKTRRLKEKPKDDDPYKSHWLNSPVFFLLAGLSLLWLNVSFPAVFNSFSNAQQTIWFVWMFTMLILAATHFWSMSNQQRNLTLELDQITREKNALQEHASAQTQQIEEQAASNAAIIETTNNAIFMLDSNFIIQNCNPAAVALFGESDKLVGQTFARATRAQGELSKYFHYQSYRQKLVNQPRGIEVDASVVDKAGESLAVHATISRDLSGRSNHLVISLANISEQKRAEHEAHNLKDRFTANISHEFRTPLTIINGVLDNLAQSAQTAESSHQIELAKRNTLRLIRMVEQLLDLAHLSTDALPTEVINIQPSISFACESFLEIASHNEVSLIVKAQHAAWVNGNTQAFEKILFNLLSNAFKYTQKGEITVRLMSTNDTHQLSVSDTGIGISPEQVGQIFERFHRIDNTTTRSVHGVGIGLALVKELCDAMGWQIDVSSTPKVGTTFSLTMPIAVPSEASESAPPSISHSPTLNPMEVADIQQSRPESKSKFSVLIVEDNRDMQAHINAILSPFHQCLVADNGEQGLRLANDYLPDIVISDVMMPGISGFDLLKTLKQDPLTSHIPIILLTARSDTSSKLRGLAYEADDYLAKPFEAEELRLRVSNKLNSRVKLQKKLAAQWQQIDTGRPDTIMVQDKFMQRLEEVFDKNYHNPDFSLQELAQTLAMSERQVQRKVKALLDVSPLEALKLFRLKKASFMLASGDQIGTIAQLCGFSSQSYFGRCFKETYGQTPKAFQQSQQ